jgi:hypothetical protein
MKHILKHVCIFSAALLSCLALTHATLHRFQKPIPKKVYVVPKIDHKKSVKRNEKLYAHLKPKPVDHEELFLRTIIENNLFAPLGWKPKKPTPTYRLIGTQIPIGKEIEATAILQETMGEATIRIVSIGTKLGEDTVVADIQPRHVILKKGKLRTPLRLATIQFLKSSRTRR